MSNEHREGSWQQRSRWTESLRSRASFLLEAVPRIARAHLFSMELADRQQGGRAAPEGYELVFPWRDIACKGPEDVVCGCAWQVLLAKMENRELLGLAIHEGEPVFRMLAQTHGRVAMTTGRWAFSLEEGQAYIHYCETDPAHRGKGIYPAMLQVAMGKLAEAGYRRAYIGCSASNKPSIRGILKAGFRYEFSEQAIVALWGRVRIGARQHQSPEMTRKT